MFPRKSARMRHRPFSTHRRTASTTRRGRKKYIKVSRGPRVMMGKRHDRYGFPF